MITHDFIIMLKSLVLHVYTTVKLPVAYDILQVCVPLVIHLFQFMARKKLNLNLVH